MCFVTAYSQGGTFWMPASPCGHAPSSTGAGRHRAAQPLQQRDLGVIVNHADKALAPPAKRPLQSRPCGQFIARQCPPGETAPHDGQRPKHIAPRLFHFDAKGDAAAEAGPPPSPSSAVAAPELGERFFPDVGTKGAGERLVALWCPASRAISRIASLRNSAGDTARDRCQAQPPDVFLR